jgi:predicted phage baseplate assembly protein
VPLPLPDLDARRWADLVDEGRALVPLLAPGWDDHNASDPGITLMELLAWLVEHDLYRVNRVPERHRRKFLTLLGFAPRPPQPARAAVAFAAAPGAPTPVLPAGLAVAATATPGGPALAFRTLAPLTVGGARIAGVQAFDGASFADVTRLWREELSFEPWGVAPGGFDAADPERQPALLVGLDAAPAVGAALSLWLGVAGGGDADEQRARLRAEALAAADACRPARPAAHCDDGAPHSPSPPAAPDPAADHHALRTVWELYRAGAWRPVDAVDDTRALTLDGAVVLTPADVAAPAQIGAVAEPRVWLRCRAAAGPPDEAPVLRELSVNAVAAEQRSPVRQAFAIVAGTAAPATAPVPGRRTRLALDMAPDGRLHGLEAGAGEPAPEALVIDYRAATATAAGELTCTLLVAGVSTGAPRQRVELEQAPVAGANLRLWTIESDGAVEWERREDLDAAGFADDVFTLDAQLGAIWFGDGRRGRVPAADAPILVAHEVTAAAAGGAPPSATWRLAGADDALDRALLGADVAAVDAQLAAIASARGASGGVDGESVAHTAGRAAETLWAHERLVELAPDPGATLDGLDPSAVQGVLAPARGATTLDLERLALAVPGTRVRRARAWPTLDARHPCLSAAGHVSVVIVPGWPPDRPTPGPELLGAVARFIARRRTIGTQVAVTGPEYVEVAVRAQVRTLPGADAAAVGAAAAGALHEYLHPLRGGPAGRGWSFGRDVRRTELLAVLDAAPGVDHVLDLVLTGPEGDGGCGDVCVGPLALVALTTVDVEALA